MARVPFAPLDNPRLQHLASAKNRQNGLISKPSPLNGNNNLTPSKPAVKRSFEPAIFEDNDGENVDPATFSSPAKKSKNGAGKPSNVNFSLATSKSMPPPPVPNRLSTPVKANTSSPRAPLTAPAGRSPNRKIASIGKNRRTSAPFTRIDPPFASRGSSNSLPFSLDAALSGTLSSTKVKPESEKQTSTDSTIQESMPKSWFFEIHEDTPEEEASNLMEHSTLTLDLSSDDESSKKERDDRGKENVAPEGYDASTASRSAAEPAVAPRAVKKTAMVRQKKITDEMDDGERSPLSDLETDPFVPEGLSTDACVIVDAAPKREEAAASSAPSQKKEDWDASHPNKDSSKDTILIWEDSPSSEGAATSKVKTQPKEGLEVADDENTAPTD
ncbi:hypothetical protein KC340_g1785 [Hortaea werneckii]|nr:hypothetical protein KC342_g1727 [Hortaea werneckii]KAI7105723.1 hypothetical protein KC339_g3617 [Hortaea werneckii]KAI7336192.1 hypothetical protein KC340_g1785 [Hortaea werneckii]KAI7391077.1 hypothetical protein KC328_g7667 [Hortaea werneckii]